MSETTGSEQREAIPLGSPISCGLKWCYWFGAWGAVVLIFILINPQELLAAPYFPLGLIALLPNGPKFAIELMMWLEHRKLGILCHFVMHDLDDQKKREIFNMVFHFLHYFEFECDGMPAP